MNTLIYSRVSTIEKNGDQQADLLKEQHEHDKVVIEKASGKDMERPKAEGKYPGRKPTDESIVEAARALKANGMKMPAIAAQLNVGQSTLYRLIK